MFRAGVVGLISMVALPAFAATAEPQTEFLAKAQTTEVWSPEPVVVSPGLDGAPPSDAMVLFDGSGFDAWVGDQGGEPEWRLIDGAMEVVKGAGDIRTKQAFADIQLHIEWATPSVVAGESQGRGNSGVFLMGRYEVQVLDSFDNRTYSNGQAGSIYKQHIPLVNASLPPGQWQSYDIVFRAPRFGKKGTIVSPAYISVMHNGVVIQNHVPIEGSTEFIGRPQYKPHGAAPIKLQDHRNPVRFRNIWVREL